MAQGPLACLFTIEFLCSGYKSIEDLSGASFGSFVDVGMLAGGFTVFGEGSPSSHGCNGSMQKVGPSAGLSLGILRCETLVVPNDIGK